MSGTESRQSERSSFDEAAVAILSILADGEWHKSTAEIHDPLRPWVPEYMFGGAASNDRLARLLRLRERVRMPMGPANLRCCPSAACSRINKVG
jgi:hypothetical protein